MATGLDHEAGVPFMQIPHGGHKPHGAPGIVVGPGQAARPQWSLRPRAEAMAAGADMVLVMTVGQGRKAPSRTAGVRLAAATEPHIVVLLEELGIKRSSRPSGS